MSRATIEILRDNLTLVPFVVVGGLATVGFQILLSRTLAPAVYGETFAVLGVLSLLATPALLIQTVIARSSARLYIIGRRSDLRAAAWSAYRRLGVAAVLVAVLIAALTPVMMRVFQLTSPWPVLVAATGAGMALMEPLFRGITQGARDFVAHGAVVAMHGLGRLGVGAIAVLSGGGSTGALLASPAAALAAVGTGAVTVRRLWRGEDLPGRVGTSPESMWQHVRVGLIVAVMAALLHLDGLVMRGFYAPEVAADYAALAVIGRSVYWSGITIGVVLLPYVVHAASRGEDYVRAYVISVGLMALVGTITALAVLLRTEFAYGLLFRDGYTPHNQLLPLYVGAAAMLAIATMTANLHIGTSNLRVWIPLTVLLGVTGVALGVAHGSEAEVLTVIFVADAVAMVYMIAEAALLTRSSAKRTRPSSACGRSRPRSGRRHPGAGSRPRATAPRHRGRRSDAPCRS